MNCRLFVALSSCVSVVFLAGMATNLSVAADSDWFQWRGPNRDSKLPKADWPDSLDEKHLTQTWRTEMGPGYSGPIVDSDRVFVTETKDRKFEVVQALDRKTGKSLWSSKWEGAMKVPFFAMANGDWIRATPAYDGERLFVAGMRDMLVCLNGSDGKILWKLDFMKKVGSPLPSFGFASSPLVMGDHVYVQAGAGFAKVDKKTGEIVWRTLKDGGAMYGSAFSSPVVATIAGKKQFVVQQRKDMAGVDPETGDKLWSREIPAMRRMNILTPTITGDQIFTSSRGGATLMLDVKRKDDKFETDQRWANKVQAYMSSPVIVDKHIYVHLNGGRLTCIELETGKSKWTTTPFGKYWSMVAAGDKILALDERGELLLIRANPEKFELISRRKISEQPTWAHLAVSGDELFVRELKAATAYRWRKP